MTKVEKIAASSILQFKSERGDVSTIHFSAGGPCLSEPVDYYETMVFGGRLDGESVRCGTQKEARANHKRMVQRVSRGLP